MSDLLQQFNSGGEFSSGLGMHARGEGMGRHGAQASSSDHAALGRESARVRPARTEDASRVDQVELSPEAKQRCAACRPAEDARPVATAGQPGDDAAQVDAAQDIAADDKTSPAADAAPVPDAPVPAVAAETKGAQAGTQPQGSHSEPERAATQQAPAAAQQQATVQAAAQTSVQVVMQSFLRTVSSTFSISTSTNDSTATTDPTRTTSAASTAGSGVAAEAGVRASVVVASSTASAVSSSTTIAAEADSASSSSLLREGIEMYTSWLTRELRAQQEDSAETSQPGRGQAGLRIDWSVAIGAGSSIGAAGGTSSTQDWLKNLDGEMYKVVMLLSAMYDSPEARDRALESLRSGMSAMSGLGAASAGAQPAAGVTPGVDAPASAAAGGVVSADGIRSANLEMRFAMQIDFSGVAGELRGQGVAEHSTLMIQLAQSMSATMQCDPLILDIAGDGINLRGAGEGVLFDITGDGTAEQTGFIQGDDALLYLDADGNGLADNGNELFGDQQGDANGFAKLARQDDNADGVIDAQDAVYNQLRVWQDRNGDGACQQEETATLEELGVQSIGVNYGEGSGDDGKGNRLAQAGSFTRADGTQGLAADALLGYYG